MQSTITRSLLGVLATLLGLGTAVAQDRSYQNFLNHKAEFALPLGDLLKQTEQDLGIQINCDRSVQKYLDQKVVMAPWKFWNDPQLRLAYLLAPLDLSFEKVDDTTWRVFEPWYYQRPEAEGKAHLDRLLRQYSNRELWEQRRATLKATMLEMLHLTSVPRATLNPNVSDKREYDGYSVRNVALEILPGYFLGGNLYEPLTEGKHPLVLCPHGHGEKGRFGEDVQTRAGVLARMGAVVFTYSMFAWRQEESPLGPQYHKDPVAGTIQTLQTMRAIDWLTTLPNVDSAKIGITGASGGGTQTFLGTALDPRITVSVPVVMVSSHFFGGCPCESGVPFHIQNGCTCNAEIAAMAAPRPMLVVAVKQDWTKNVPEVEFPYLQKIYEYYGAKENVQFAYSDEPHNYGATKRSAMYPFLAQHLGLDMAQCDESKVTLEEMDAMLYFGPNHENYPAHGVKTLDELKQVLADCTDRFAQNLAQYRQEFTLTFATPEEAEAAQLTKMELPPGKTLAISARWDDSNEGNLKMSPTLAANGWKGTFFLNACTEDYNNRVVSRIIQDGNTVGVHTTHHPHLGETVPNQAFKEIMGNRVDLETRTNLSISTFTFPFGLGEASSSENVTSAEQGLILTRTGLLGGPETINMAQRLHLKPEQFISPFRFNANDRDPNLETFEQGWNNGLKQIQNGQFTVGPYMVLGTHAWHNSVHEDGFDRLGAILATQANKPEYWYCTCNEYTAYRLNYVLARVEKKSVQGNQATFVVYRFEPQALGADVGLGLKATSAPQKANFPCGKVILLMDNGEFLLPNAAIQTLPEQIDHIANTGNLPSTDESLASSKFPGLKIGSQVDLEKNTLTVTIQNQTDKELTNVKGQIRLPLRWMGSTVPSWFVGQIASQETKTLTIPLGEVSPDPRCGTFELYIDNQCDFQLDGKRGRIHSTVTVPQP